MDWGVKDLILTSSWMGSIEAIHNNYECLFRFSFKMNKTFRLRCCIHQTVYIFSNCLESKENEKYVCPEL